MVGIAQTCHQCKTAGKNIKPLLRQKQIGKLPKCTKINQEIAIDFVGLFQNAIGAKKVPISLSRPLQRLPEAKILRKPNTEKVIEVLKKYITRHRIHRTIRTGPATIFKSQKFKEFCKEWYINHIECPIKDHRGNGKIERLIRTINERLRTNKKVIVTKDKTGLSETLFALRMKPSATKKSPFEQHTGQEPNTIKRIRTNHKQNISDNQEVNI